MSDTQELTVDEELDRLYGKMFSVRKAPKEKPVVAGEPDEVKIVSKKDKSRMKDARRKSKQGSK
jgi:hypothetical protein